MKKPIVAIASNLESWQNVDKVSVNRAYSEAVRRAGGIPVIVAATENREEMYDVLAIASGILIPGGCDIDPLLFGQEPEPGTEESRPDLDVFQIGLAGMALERKMPLLGICRGEQVLNVAMGGTLIQDIASSEGMIKHRQQTKNIYPTHNVIAEPESIVGKTLGTSFPVNSHHHQAVDRPGKGLRVSARAKDGITEAIELDDHPFAVGVQWHPEAMLAGKNTTMLPLFEAFISACIEANDRK